MKVLVAGAGYVGLALCAELAQRGDEVIALRRHPPTDLTGFASVAADLVDPASLRRAATNGELPEDVDALVYCAAAKRRDQGAYRGAYVDGLRNLLSALRKRGSGPERVIFTSSTAVYEQRDGGWVDERSPTEPDAETARILLEAEAITRDAAEHATVLRLAGIYGPGRTRLLDRIASGEARIPHTPVYTNRIHRDDCAGLLARLLELDAPPPLVVGVDDRPVDVETLYRFLAAELGVPTPAHADEEAGPLAFGRSHKRCRSVVREAIGYHLRVPSYREGYRDMIAARAGARRP